MRDILSTPYVVGGRTPGVGIDCLGVVAEIARRRGVPAPDGWPSIEAAYRRGEIDHSGFPAGWVRVDAPADPYVIRDGDVLLFYGTHPWCAIVHAGHVYSSSREHGSAYCVPGYRWKVQPAEVWRWQP
jgi:cell wall-associated NlpC family hydrolase